MTYCHTVETDAPTRRKFDSCCEPRNGVPGCVCWACRRDDGACYVRAIEGAREMREIAAYWQRDHDDRLFDQVNDGMHPVFASERERGIPEGWFTR